MSNTLLASAGSLENITKLTSKFFCDMPVKIEMASKHGFVRRVSDDKILDGVTVTIERGRYRLEMVTK